MKLLLLLVFLSPFPATASPASLKELGLSKAQLGKIQAIREEARKKLSTQRKEIQESQTRLDRLMETSRKGPKFEKKIWSEFETLQRDEKEMARLQLKNVLAVRQVLTPGQLKRFTQMHRRDVSQQ